MKYFTLEEMTRSTAARKQHLDNTPTEAHRRNLIELIEHLLDDLREAWEFRCRDCKLGAPALRVLSGYRGFQLNKAVGGSATSAHCFGLAADLAPTNGRMEEFKCFCREFLSTRAFDQMISENENEQGKPQWIHIGYKNRQGQQRRQFLTMRSARYIPMTS